jgi:hypothetical protein
MLDPRLKPFEDVARRLCGGDPPPDIVARLAKFAPVVSLDSTHTLQDYLDDVALIAVLKKVEEELQYRIGPAYEFLDDEDDEALKALEELEQAVSAVLPFLESELGPKPVGKPRHTGPQLCAKLCADIWTRSRGKSQPWSTKLHAACQAYWIACGGTTDNISWDKVLNGR